MQLNRIGIYLLLFLGIYLRAEDFLGGHWPFYIHDRERHMEYIHYVNATGKLPPPDRGIEFPQQPLYYFLVAQVYDPGRAWKVNEAILAAAGLVISIFGLGVLASSLKYISSGLVRLVVMAYVAFTPSFILAAPFIGNDGMVQVTGMYLFFCAMRFNRGPLISGRYYLLLVAILLALFSKLNAVTLLPVLPWAIFRSWQALPMPRRLSVLGVRCGVLAMCLLFWMGVTKYHGELGRAADGFKMVNTDKAGLAPMFIPDTGLQYLLSFHFFSLLQAGQATTLKATPDSVRFSLPTFLYGTMLFGEHEYSHPPKLAVATGPVIISGLILLIGAAAFAIHLPIRSGQKMLRNLCQFLYQPPAVSLLTLAIMLAASMAVYNYVNQAPYTCNTDFRFEYPAVAWIGFGAGRGLAILARFRWIRYGIWAGLAGYVISCIGLIHAAFTYAFTD